jgi:BirA family biotin operon repressor/biotin-[acetyl-CoA-carboxylase] ligase
LKSLVVLDSVDSTQDEVIRRLKSGSRVDAVMAFEQTAGRGRFGKSWLSPKDTCLALSFAWHEAKDCARPEFLALCAGVVAAEVFDTSIAWPNDLVVDGRKVGGILSEVVPCALGKVPVIGFGVNLTMATPPDGVPWASSLLLEGRPRMVPLDAAAALLDALAKQPPPASFSEIETRWSTRDATAGKQFKLHDGRTGKGLGVTKDGNLMVVVNSEEITLASAEAIYGSGS